MVKQSVALVAENDQGDPLLPTRGCHAVENDPVKRPGEEFGSGRYRQVAPLLRLRPDVLANALLSVFEGQRVFEDVPEPVELELPTVSDQPETEDSPEIEALQSERVVEDGGEIESVADDPEPFVERRVLPRRTGTAVVRVVRIPTQGSMTSQQRNWELHGTPLRGELEEISLQSVACLLGEPFSPGEAVYVRLTNPRTHRTLDVPAEVVRVRFLNGDDRWKVVCQLHRSLTLCELHQFAYASEPLPVSDLEESHSV